MTFDSEGLVWMCGDSVARFDPMTEMFTTAAVSGYTGCMAEQGEDGLLWMSSYFGGTGVIGVNRETLAVEAQWPTPDAYGVSIDFYGYVWTVNNSGAHRVDPATGEVTSYNGLVGAYTYSDALGNVRVADFGSQPAQSQVSISPCSVLASMVGPAKDGNPDRCRVGTMSERWSSLWRDADAVAPSIPGVGSGCCLGTAQSDAVLAAWVGPQPGIPACPLCGLKGARATVRVDEAFAG